MPDALQAVTNSTCLIGLERIEQLDILPQVFSTITVPTAVQAEVGISADWLTIRTVQNLAVVATLKTQVDEGEAEEIALAMELGDVFVILDDRNARRIAEQLSLKVIGTVGMLLRAFTERCHHRDQATTNCPEPSGFPHLRGDRAECFANRRGTLVSQTLS